MEPEAMTTSTILLDVVLLQWAMVLPAKYRLFDVGGTIGLIGMSLVLMFFTTRNAYRLYWEERIR